MDAGTQKYRALVSSVDTGSFAGAAKALDYSISSVSRMVADLESDCGFPLLIRAKSGVTPTVDGKRMVACARRIVDECDRFEDTAREIAGLEVGTVRIGTFSSIATHWLPSVLKSFRADHPKMEYELLMGDYSEIESWVDEGRVDLGFLRDPIGPHLNSALVVADHLVAVLPTSHPMAGEHTFPLAAFAEEPFIALERDDNTEGADLFRKHGIDIAPALSSWDDYAIMSMVEAGLGLAMLPGLIMKRCAYDLVTLPLDVDSRRDIKVVWKASRPLPTAARALLRLMESHAKTE